MPVGSLSVRSPPAEKVDLWPEAAEADLEGLDEARCQLDGTRWGTHPHEQAGGLQSKVRYSDLMPNQVLLVFRGAYPSFFLFRLGPFVEAHIANARRPAGVGQKLTRGARQSL
jgi:hypothetical protein